MKLTQKDIDEIKLLAKLKNMTVEQTIDATLTKICIEIKKDMLTQITNSPP